MADDYSDLDAVDRVVRDEAAAGLSHLGDRVLGCLVEVGIETVEEAAEFLGWVQSDRVWSGQ